MATKTRPEPPRETSTSDVDRGMHSNIARRAYELFETRGRHHGRDLDDWLSAEAELLNRPDRSTES